MATLDQLRSLFPNAATDADVITQAADRYGISPAEIASEVGYAQSRSGLTSQQFSSAIDRYQAGLYGVGEAALGALGAESASGWMAAQRRENELRANLASERAREMGAVQEWKDVHGIGDFGSYAKGLAIQSVPYAAEALAGGLVTRGLMSGTRAALAGAQTVEELAAARKALNIGSTVGGVAASYPSAVGDVLSNQREEAGVTNLGAAAALGVPYAALNAFGVEGALSRGMGARAVNMLDRTTGVTGAALRTGSSMAKSGAQEAVGETLQEVTNQLGRMAVNPNVSLTDEAALERYKESAIGGAVLGGLFGSVGGWRRSTSFLPGSNETPETPATPTAPKNEFSQEFTAKSEASAENIMAGLAGQPNLLGGRASLYEGATVPAPPVVAGGETDVAFAQQQAAQEQQAAQTKQAEEARRAQAFETMGATFSPENGGQLNILGQTVFGPAIEQFGNRLGGMVAAMPSHVSQITKAIATANAETGNKLVSFKYNGTNPMGSAEALVKALGKVADKFQIGHVESTQQAAGILNKLSETTKGATLDQINAIHFALTGENTTGWEASQTTKAKGAKNGTVQTTAGVGEVPVQGGAGEAISGGAGDVRPAQVEPVGAGSVGAGPLGLQTGQPSEGGIRPGAGADTGAGAGNLAGQGQGPGALNEAAAPTQTSIGRGQVLGEPQQAGQPQVAEGRVPTEARVYEPRIPYYASDLSHIPATRRVEIITQLLHSVLAPKQERGNVIQAATRMEILRLALLEQFPHKSIAEYTKLTEAAVAKQLERMGVALVGGEFRVTDPEFAGLIRTAAEDFRSVEFPDGIGEGELAGLYATKYEGPDVEAKTMAEEMQEGEQEGKPGAKLQEELHGKEEGEGKSMGTVATAGGSQGAVEADDAAFFAKVEKMQAQLEQLAPQDPRREQLAKDIKSAWDKYAKKQAERAEADMTVEVEGEEGAVQEPSAEEVPVRQRARGGKKVGKGDTEGGKAAAEGKPAAEEIRTPQEQWEALAEKTPGMPPYESLTKEERTRWDDLAHRGVANLAAANRILPAPTPLVIDVEARVIDETVGPQVAKLPAPQVARLETHYGLKSDTAEFLARVKEDVVLYATKGAEAVSAAIRDIIKAIHSGVLAVAMIFNPTAVSQIESFVVIPQETQTTTQQVLAELPAEVQGMSEAGKRAYATLIPALKGKIGDKFITIADKPSGRVFVFKANGELVLQKKALFGLAKGDLYKGNNDLPQNRVTPAGLFGIHVVDAAKGGAAAKTAGEYDFGKVFALDDPDATVTFMHSVWLKETDAAKRAAALKNDSAADSRYSFGCINLDKDTFRDMVTKYGNQMDGSKLFVVPDVQTTVDDFITGNVANDRLVREGVQPVTKTTTTPVKSATKTAGVDRTVAAKEEEASGDLKFGKDTTESKVKNPYTAAQLLAEIKAFVRADIPGRKLIIVDSVEDLLASPDPKVREVAQALARNGAYGVASDGRGFLIANRIEQGRGRAKFMHEVGAHLGLENLLPKALYDKLTQQLVDWAKRADDSLESDLAIRAAERVMHARTPKEDQRSELLAYFIEEAMQAGIDPTAEVKNSPALTAWFRTLWAAFKIAVRKLGFNPEKLTAQDVVNLAFGAARLEMSGTFHGTAAQFRRFSHKFMGSGEGAQAYGWGTYLAQRAGIAKGYWAADVDRKQGPMGEYLKPGSKTAASLERLADRLRAAPEEALAAFGKYGPAPTVRSVLGMSARFVFDQNFHQRLLDVVDRMVRRGASVSEAIDAAMTSAAPEGAFMRVDTALDSSNTLNWDTPLSQQPEVLATLREKMPMPIQEAIADQFNQNVEDLSDLTGEDLYRALQYLENSQGLVTEFMENEPAGQKADKVASKFLDSIGIAGLKFLDATSRKQARVEERIAQAERKLAREEQALRDLHIQLDGERQELMDKLAAAEAEVAAGKKWSKMSVDQMKRFIARLDDPNGTNAMLLSVYEDNVRMAKDNLATQQAKLTAPVTRNLVVFNDANIFRVGSAIGADKQRMKFGIESTVGNLPKAAQKPVRNSIASITDFANKALDRLVFTSDVVNRAVDAGIQSARKFERLLAERGTKARELERAVERIADQYATLPEKDKGTGPDSVNQFLFDSTRTMKWGYGQYRDAEMGARFDALDPKSQEFIKSVFAYGDKILSQKKQTVVDYTTSEYDAAIAKETDPAKKAQLKTEKAADLKKFETLFAIREGKPYAPIKRVGDYVVVAKSDAYREAEQNGDTKELRKLESDPDHYHVSFTETKSEARALADQLREQGFFGASADAVDFFEKAKYGEDLFGNSSSLDAITRLRSMTDAKAAAGEKGAAALQRLVTDLYLQSLAEGSARKSEMRRRGVAGEVDMLRSFAAQGRADAQFIASVEMNPQVQDAIQEMRGQVARGGNRERKSELMNELMARYDQTLERTPNPVINKITRLSSIYYLATSPAYYLQNLTQPWMMSLPAMAGHHDYGKASTQLFKAYTDLGGVMKSAQLFGQQFDFSKVPADVRQAIQELANRGKIDIGLETELGEFKIDGSGPLTDRWNKVDKGLRIAVQKVEAINRLSTAIAAYRLELAKTGSSVAALDYADRILTETHGDYTGFNAPRAFNHPVGKVALQFRKFQLIQLTFYAKLIRDAFTGADRAMAMKTLAYSLGHTGMLAGVMGLPGYAAVSAILGALFGDDDEEYDLTKELRKMIGDEDIANLILRGAPTIAGMDLSGKVGAGNMLSIMPYSQADLTTRAGVIEAIGTLLGGAAGGMAAKFADGLGLMLKGDWYKGLEQMLPKGAADAMKAARIANEGMTRRNGDVVLPASEVSGMDTFWQALGISPVKQSVVYERQQNIREMDQRFQDRSTEIKNRYTKAAKSGDTGEMAAQREAWTKLQTARMNNGYTRQPISDLLKAPQQQAKRERQTVGGVQYNKANRAAVMAEANL